MRKSRFLLGLIAATAIGLSAVGCESSSSGGIADTTDLEVPANNNNGNEQRNLREYVVIGQRGLDTFAPDYTGIPGASSPTIAGGQVVADPGDGANVAQAQLMELLGIASTPSPNARPVLPGSQNEGTFNVPGEVAADGTSGYHGVYSSPNGDYVIAISRARNRGFSGDTVDAAYLQVYAMNFAQPLDTPGGYPPNIVFGTPADELPILFFQPDQGDFVSGAWSSNAQQFYASYSNRLNVFSFNGNIGRLDSVQSIDFPAGGDPDEINNAAQIIVSPDGSFVWAFDNANGNILTYARNSVDGSLTQVATTPTVADVRGASLDRSGRYLYVTGRSSEQLAGYNVGADGSLELFDLFPDIGLGPVPFSYGEPLGDVACNPRNDTLFLGSYAGLVQAFNINTSNGSLIRVGEADGRLNAAHNLGNVEVEPTGRFLVTTFEHDFESLLAQGEAGDPVFANTDSNTNGVLPFSATPNFDSLGRIVFVGTDDPYVGEMQVWRIGGNADGGPRPEESVDSVNPYGITFFQKVLTPPAGVGPIQP